jgi:hypothetical protein
VGRRELKKADSTTHFKGRTSPVNSKRRKHSVMEFELPFFPMPITRSRVMLEAASELVGMKIWSYRQARISLRDQEEGEWKISLFGSDNIEAIEAVDRGEVHIATLNPAAPLSLAYRGCGPFTEPISVRAIAINPESN